MGDGASHHEAFIDSHLPTWETNRHRQASAHCLNLICSLVMEMVRGWESGGASLAWT